MGLALVAASQSADPELEDLTSPPPPPPDVNPGGIILGKFEALERASEGRCGALRELCANMECRIASGAGLLEADLSNQEDALNKLESALDRLIKSSDSLFATPKALDNIR